uniref:VQ domain-containing protein n=1 Tax=Davidia involucrata TaxID=16924 RepID=A0A5B6YQW3_DAVIN
MDIRRGGGHLHDHVKNKNNKKNIKRKREKVKVVYISSPMKVNTSASKFRALVQELTGRHSDVSRLMELDGTSATDYGRTNLDLGLRPFDHDHVSVAPSPMRDPLRESPTSSDSFPQPLDGVLFSSHMEQQFSELFSSNFLYESSQFDDVLGSYDAL